MYWSQTTKQTHQKKICFESWLVGLVTATKHVCWVSEPHFARKHSKCRWTWTWQIKDQITSVVFHLQIHWRCFPVCLLSWLHFVVSISWRDEFYVILISCRSFVSRTLVVVSYVVIWTRVHKHNLALGCNFDNTLSNSSGWCKGKLLAFQGLCQEAVFFQRQSFSWLETYT